MGIDDLVPPELALRLLPADHLRSQGRVFRVDAFRHGCSGLLLVPGGPAGLPYVRAARLLGKIRAPDPATRAPVLAPRRLRELYVTEREPTVEIAGMAKCAATTVRALLALDGIPLRTLSPEAEPPDFLRTWPHREPSKSGGP
ncbi:hypothetical protein [Streptomyces uncialis]|uniref:hypothetical protein n=1 Tax=Streptomyces uncialis TaxID=1048205 RepID=UPI0037A433EC